MTKDQPNSSDDFRARSEGMDARTTTLAGSATPGRSLGLGRDPKIDAFCRRQADKAIARIEECCRRGLDIPDVR